MILICHVTCTQSQAARAWRRQPAAREEPGRALNGSRFKFRDTEEGCRWYWQVHSSHIQTRIPAEG